MGTLTADVTRLPEYCEHKLPTSCRLTFIPDCCACADERAHAASYSTYIDGIGFVLRGNRWQRYCWFCKEFWAQRVTVSGLRPGQTRIPELPDQTEFLERWYEFHRGYRLTQREDGSEERVAVLGEHFKDVSPGCLPRTLEELRLGRREEEAQVVQQEAPQATEPAGPSLEDTLERMFEDATAEDAATASNRNPTSSESTTTTAIPAPAPLSNNIHAQVMNPTSSRNREYQLRRVAALRRELNRMRSGIERVISGLRDLGEDVPDSTGAASSLAALGNTLEHISGARNRQQTEQVLEGVNAPASSSTAQSSDHTLATMQRRVDDARSQVEEARRIRNHAASELDGADTELRASQQRLEQSLQTLRTTENYMRIFGTREEMLAQGENYESPIGGLFSRAYDRFRVAEDARTEERTLRQVLADEAAAGGEEDVRRLAELESRERDVWGVPRMQTPALRAIAHDRRGSGLDTENGITTPPHLAATPDETMLQEYYAMMRQEDRTQRADSEDSPTDPEQLVITEMDTAAELPGDNFPSSMLSAVRAARERERTTDEVSRDPVNYSYITENANEYSTAARAREQWQREDVQHMMRVAATNSELAEMLTPEDVSFTGNMSDNGITPEDELMLDRVRPEVIWASRLPGEWLQRRRQRVVNAVQVGQLLFTDMSSGPSAGDWNEHYNYYITYEILAQAYQMSAEVRRCAELSPPERLQMLYRLQSGQRTMRDIENLRSIYRVPEDYLLAMSTYQRTLAREHEDSEPDLIELDDSRRNMAREGNHSRTELQTRRQETASLMDLDDSGRALVDHGRTELETRRQDTASAFALAAGRQAMQTGSDTLIEQAAVRDAQAAFVDHAGMRAAMRRLALNNSTRARPPRMYRQLTLSEYLNDASSDSNSENEGEAEPAGLDAAETGRPEPKGDEELNVQMECKVCYTQLAEVACLPCGHLVMSRSNETKEGGSLSRVQERDKAEGQGV